MKTLFQYLKLLAAVLLLLILVAVLLDLFIPLRPYHRYEFEMLLAAVPLLLAAGAALFWWFFRTRRAARMARTQPPAPSQPRDPYHSRFYSAFRPLVARFDGRSINGFGVKYFTWAGLRSDESMMVTRWLVLGYFPVVPLYAQRVLVSPTARKFRLFYQVETTSVKVLEQVPLSKKLNRTVYVFYYLVFYPLMLLPLVWLLVNRKTLGYWFPGASLWVLLLLYLAWGICLIWISELFNKRFFLRKKP